MYTDEHEGKFMQGYQAGIGTGWMEKFKDY